MTPIIDHRHVRNRHVCGRLAILCDAAHVATPLTGRDHSETLEEAGALAHAVPRLTWSHLEGDAAEKDLRTLG